MRSPGRVSARASRSAAQAAGQLACEAARTHSDGSAADVRTLIIGRFCLQISTYIMRCRGEGNKFLGKLSGLGLTQSVDE